MSDNVLKTKIRPYPIEVQLVGTGVNFSGNIVKVVETGFLVEMDDMVRAGQLLVASFQLPLQNSIIEEEVVVIKTYDRYREHGPEERSAYLLVEMQFKHLDELRRKDIKNFMIRIGQKN